MFASGFLVVALALAAPPAMEAKAIPSDESTSPPAMSIDDLNACVREGNYHLIRQEKIGHVLSATGEVTGVAATNRPWVLVDLPGFLSAALQALPEDHGLKVGDRVRFRGMIVDEGYACLQLWTYEFEKLPSESATGEPAKGDDAESDSADGPISTSVRDLDESKLPPKTSIAELEKIYASGAGDGRRKVGYRVEGAGVVERSGGRQTLWPSPSVYAEVHSVFEGLDVKPGDRIRFEGVIVEQTSAAVTIWARRIDRSTAVKPAPPTEPDAPANSSDADLFRCGSGPAK